MTLESNVKQSWWQMTSIQIGGVICLPILMAGQELARTYGFAKAALLIIIGNSLLFLLGLVKIRMAYKNKKTTIQNAKDYFDKKGTKLFASTIIVSLVGWFAIQLNLISLSVEKGLGAILGYNPINPLILNIIIGAIITLAALKGIRALNKLSDISMPVLAIAMGYTLYKAFVYGGVSSAPVIAGSYKGISLVLASSLLAIIDFPTYYRFAKSLKDGVISILATVILATSAIELIGTYVAIKLPGATILETLTAYSGTYYQVFILLFLVLAGWTTNNANLYSSSVTLENIYPKLSQTKSTLLVGFIGTFISCFNVIAKFEATLALMGILISSMGAVIAVRYIAKCFFKYLPKISGYNLIAWGFGVVQGFFVFFNIFSISGIEIIDAFVISFVASVLVTILQILLLSCKNSKVRMF